MTVMNLYRYVNEDDSVTITPVPRSEQDIPTRYRLIADEGMLLHKGDIVTPVFDTEDTDGWSEIIDEEMPGEDETDE